MSALRPPFTISDIPATAVHTAVGLFLGFGTAIAILLVADGLWMFFLILIPLFALQLLGNGIMHLIVWALACLWALLRGRPMPSRPPSLPRAAKTRAEDGPNPWLRDYALFLSWTTATILIIANAWRAGVFTEGFL